MKLLLFSVIFILSVIGIWDWMACKRRRDVDLEADYKDWRDRLYQDPEGTIPVEKDGDRVGCVKDISRHMMEHYIKDVKNGWDEDADHD